MTSELSVKRIDQVWAEEAENRIDAYDRGELESVSVDEVIAGFSERHREVLQNRESEAGKFSDWTDAKQEMRDRVNCVSKLNVDQG